MEDYFEYFCVLKRTDMKKHGLIRLLLAALIAVTSGQTAFAGTPKVDLKVILTSVSGESTVWPDDNETPKLTVPLKAEFKSSITSDDDRTYIMFQRWTVKRLNRETSDDVVWESILRIVNENESASEEFEFTDNGTFQVSFAWSYREKDSVNAATIPGEEKQPMSFTIDDSYVRLNNNAFSPNGDGINDVFKISVRSIVDLKIAIFNRWGQTIKTISGQMENILNSTDIISVEDNNDGGYLLGIWDGRFNGDIVNDGVYYINVQATGAGGSTFEKRADINVLKGRAN